MGTAKARSRIRCEHGDDDSAFRCELRGSSDGGRSRREKTVRRSPRQHTEARSPALHTCEKNAIQSPAALGKLTAAEPLQNWQTNVSNVPDRNSAAQAFRDIHPCAEENAAPQVADALQRLGRIGQCNPTVLDNCHHPRQAPDLHSPHASSDHAKQRSHVPAGLRTALLWEIFV